MDLSALDDIETDSSQGIKLQPKADIMFCIDKSGSMYSCIDGVKNNIHRFADTLENDNIDFRVGFVSFDSDSYDVELLTSNVASFKKAVSSIDLGGDEVTLPAVDLASGYLIKADIGEKRHKFIVIFTDEPIDGNADVSLQKEKLSELINKLNDNHIKIYFLGKDCEEYKEFMAVNGCLYSPIKGNYDNVNFDEMLCKIGSSISNASQQVVGQSNMINVDSIYNIEEDFNIKINIL